MSNSIIRSVNHVGNIKQRKKEKKKEKKRKAEYRAGYRIQEKFSNTTANISLSVHHIPFARSHHRAISIPKKKRKNKLREMSKTARDKKQTNPPPNNTT